MLFRSPDPGDTFGDPSGSIDLVYGVPGGLVDKGRPEGTVPRKFECIDTHRDVPVSRDHEMLGLWDVVGILFNSAYFLATGLGRADRNGMVNLG